MDYTLDMVNLPHLHYKSPYVFYMTMKSKKYKNKRGGSRLFRYTIKSVVPLAASAAALLPHAKTDVSKASDMIQPRSSQISTRYLRNDVPEAGGVMREDATSGRMGSYSLFFRKSSGALYNIYQTFVDHKLSQKTLQEIENHEITWKPIFSYHEGKIDSIPAVEYKIEPTVKTYGAIEHMLEIIENLYGKGAPLEQNMQDAVIFFNILKILNDLTGQISNEMLLFILRKIEIALATALASGRHSVSSDMFFNHFLQELLKEFRPQEILASISMVIFLIEKYDVIEKRKAQQELKKQYGEMLLLDDIPETSISILESRKRTGGRRRYHSIRNGLSKGSPR